jgi:hypothetical protein
MIKKHKNITKLTTKIQFSFLDLNVDSSLLTTENFLDLTKIPKKRKTEIITYKNINKNALF